MLRHTIFIVIIPLLVLAATVSTSSQTYQRARAVPPQMIRSGPMPNPFFGTIQERRQAEPCIKNLCKISLAITHYRKDHEDLHPNNLSDLYPKYITDKSVFICPRKPNGIAFQSTDLHIKCSYIYDFSTNKREWKTNQLKQYGDKTPIIRCDQLGIRTLSLSYGGEIYFSNNRWESDIPKGHTLDDADAKIRAKLLKIAVALDLYKKDHEGDVPDALEELLPKYVEDETTIDIPDGRPSVYQFRVSNDIGGGRTPKEWKKEQLIEYGEYVPIVRAYGVLKNGNVINLAYSGEIYESPSVWESFFTRRVPQQLNRQRSPSNNPRPISDKYLGIGLMLNWDKTSNQGLIVYAVQHNSPAEKQGLKSDDLIVAVNGVALGEQESDEKNRSHALSLIRKVSHGNVRLTIVPRGTTIRKDTILQRY